MKRILSSAAVLCLWVFCWTPSAQAESITVPMVQIGQTSSFQTIGDVTFTDTKKGLEVVLNMGELPPGVHGFHIHEFPNCGPLQRDGMMVAGLEAGGHYDPMKTNKHLGPGHPKTGHLGDLPRMEVKADGRAEGKLLVPGLKVRDIRRRAVIIDADGDNYSDVPLPNGGGGERIICGIIQ